MAPMQITGWAPMRWMTRPVMKPGRNMAIECARITSALSFTPKPQNSICSGVEAMIRFIVP